MVWVAADQHQNAIQSIGVDTWGVDFSFVTENDSLIEPVLRDLAQGPY